MTQKAGSKQQQQLHPNAHTVAVGALLLGALKVHQAWPTRLSYKQGEAMCSASPTSPTAAGAEAGSMNPCSLRALLLWYSQTLCRLLSLLGCEISQLPEVHNYALHPMGSMGSLHLARFPLSSWAGQLVITRTPAVSSTNVAMQQC